MVASDLPLKPRNLAYVLIDVAVGISILIQHDSSITLRNTMSKSYASKAILLAVLFTVIVVPTSRAQDDTPTSYFQVDFMKVAPGNEAEYLDVEHSIWKPIHEARQRAGNLVSWSLYMIRYPSGTNTEYNFVTVNAYSDFNHTENSFSDNVVQQAHPGASEADRTEMMNRTGASRDLVRSEMWMLHDVLAPSSPAQYVTVTHMTVPPGGGEDYLTLEREIWKPIHAASVEAGYRSGWGVYSMMFPNGASEPYNYGTVNFFDEYSDIVADVPDEVWENAHPGYTEAMWDDVFARTLEVRSVYDSQLWQLVETTNTAAYED